MRKRSRKTWRERMLDFLCLIGIHEDHIVWHFDDGDYVEDLPNCRRCSKKNESYKR